MRLNYFKCSLLGLTVLCGFAVKAQAEAADNPDLETAILLYQDGQGEEQHYESILETFESAAAGTDDPRALFYLGRMYQRGHGTEQDFAKSLRYFRQTLELDPEYKGVWLNIGRLYEAGGSGLPRNYRKAGVAYTKSAANHAEAEAYFRLYTLSWKGWISVSDARQQSYQTKAIELGHPKAAWVAGYEYFHGRRQPHDRKKAAEYFELAHANGSTTAAYKAGTYFERAPDGDPPDAIEAARFYEMAASLENPDPEVFVKLGRIGNRPEVVEHYGAEKIAQWKELRRRTTSATKEQASVDLMLAKTAFDEGRPDRAAVILKEGFEAWSQRFDKQWNWEYMGRVWREAQTESGRSDLEWGRFIFAWLADEIFARPDAFGAYLNHQDTRVGVRTNLSGRLISIGRYGLLRKRTAEIKDHIRTVDGLNIDQILAEHSLEPDYTVSNPGKLPIRPQAHPERIRQWSRPSNDLLAAYTVEAMEPLSLEAISLGNWEAALIYAQWIENWIGYIDATGQTPQSTYGGYQGDIREMPWALRARAFQALGLPDRAAEQYQASIAAGIMAYKGRALHRSHIHFANYRVDQGQASEVDLAKLKEVEAAMQENRFAESHEWQFAKLARARVLAVTENYESGRILVDQVRAFTSTTHLPLLRMEALLVASRLSMDSGDDQAPVESWLREALKWARDQGLLFEELRIYELYVRHLIAIGDYSLALEMQNRVLDLINGLKLEPRRELAHVRLAEIYALLGDDLQARALLATITRSEYRRQVEAVLQRLQAPETGPARANLLDLQPLRIVSAPLKGNITAIFILSNPSPAAARATLRMQSPDFTLISEAVSTDAIILDLAPGPGVDGTIVFEVPGKSQMPLALRADGLDPSIAAQSIKFSLLDDGSRASEWIVQSGPTNISVAVVDAALIKNNPFYLIPVFHHISSKEQSAEGIALRTVASEPTRIECFDSEGRLLFVDAEGNGSFEDPGDLVATNQVRGLHPFVELGEADRLIEMRYQPIHWENTSRVEVKIETLGDADNASWETNVIDWLER